MKNKNLLIILGAVIGIAVLVAVLEKTHVINLYQKKTSETAQGPTAEQKQQETEANADTKQQFIEGQSKEDNANPPAAAPSKSIELTAKQEPDNSVTVFTKLPGYSSGTCELTVTNGAAVKTQSAPVMYQPEFSSCAGFSVPIDPLGKGIWTINLSVTSGGTTESKILSHEVK